MAKGVPGADSSAPVTSDLIKSATDIIGQAPKFWGRYFTSPSTTGSVEYHHAKEDQPLAEAGIRVLPIARQTAHVAGTKNRGVADAKRNVDDILATFPLDHLVKLGGQFLMFLDVEGLPQTGSPSLSLEFYTGWGQTLVDHSRSQTNNAVTILPGVYARRADTVTWNNLVKAVANGIPCAGAWVARFRIPKNCKLTDFDPAFVLPKVQLPFKVLLTQYAGNCGLIDCNQTNPDINAQNEFLNKLILPPSGS
jgi:hypothetical protein